MVGKLVALTAAIGLLFVPMAEAATTDTATAEASPGPYLVGQPITFTSTSPCTVPCRLIWTYLNGTRLGEQLGEGQSVTKTFTTAGLKTVELRLAEPCVGTTRLVCSSVALVSVFVEEAPSAADTTPPTFAVSGVEVEATGPTTVVDYAFSARDPDDAVVSQSCTPPPGSSFAVGATPITCTATDSHGNVGTETFDVVVADTTPPALHVPATIATEATSAAGAAVAFAPAPSAEDLVDGAVTPSCSHASGATFPLGTTTVTCTASDAHGNSSSASFDVVVADTTAPALSVPGALVVNATSPAGVAVTYTATANDVVDGAVTPSCSPASGAVVPIGTTTITCTARDSRGNVSPAQSFTVHVKSALEQLQDVRQQVAAWRLKSDKLLSRIDSATRAVAQSAPKSCRLLADLDHDLTGSLGKELTAAQVAWLRGELARIATVVGCGSR